MKPYEDEVLLALYNKDIIGMNYKSTEKVSRIIKWKEISRKYGVNKKFQVVIRKLINKGLVSDHGKSGKVVSLTKDGLRRVYELLEE